MRLLCGHSAVAETPGAPASHGAGAPYSRFVRRVRRRYAPELTLLGPAPLSRAALDALIDTLVAGGRPLAAALRVARHLTIERLAVLDIERQAPLETVTQAMTLLAELCLERALAAALAEQDARHGAPLRPDGQRAAFWVLGMGKLGGRELNVSSDIDLVYVYDEDGSTAGGGSHASLSNHEYFSRVARSLYGLIGETTDDGQVFRVDLALRPNGNSGPPVASLAMLEEYFLVQGREWERFAWLKSRIVAPAAAVSSAEALGLRDVVVAFVFRRYLGYGVFEGLRQLHRKVRDDAARRAAGRPERANDVKLSRGGIREIEFTVQLLQVVRGGQFPELRSRSTLTALDRLAAVGVMRPDTAARLAEAYRFLRRLEHRIQYLDDQQTHQLPTDDADLAWLAGSMGLACTTDTGELLDTLGAHREFVATEFDALLHDGRAPPPGAAPGACRNCGGLPQPVDSAAFIEAQPASVAARLQVFCAAPRVALLRDDTKLRLARLVSRAVKAVDEGQLGDACADDEAQRHAPVLRFIDWLEPLLRRENYLALLAERSEVLVRLLRLLGLARWPMRYLMRHPGVIDELADSRALQGRFERAAYLHELEARHSAWTRGGQANEESLLDTLRRAHHAEVFRTLVRDVDGELSVEQVADDLSALADATLDCTIRWAWQHLKQRHRDDPRFAVVAYGKLGGKELGYGSDLDVVFLFDDADEPDTDRAAEVYAAFARKLVGWLTLRTAAGELFDIDTALRPNGNSGLLVTSIAAFERYQTQRGSNTAWTWEHQAITRARWCAGEPSLAPRVEAVRRAVLAAPRELGLLLQEVKTMRERVRAAHPQRGRDGCPLFDVKHGEGGMMDVEFAVQALVLGRSAGHAALREDLGNIALLRLAEAAGLLPPGVGSAAADAYRELRRAQHRARLDEAPTHFADDALGSERAAVRALTHAVFGATPAP